MEVNAYRRILVNAQKDIMDSDVNYVRILTF